MSDANVMTYGNEAEEGKWTDPEFPKPVGMYDEHNKWHGDKGL